MDKNDSFIKSKEIDMRINIIFDDMFFYKTNIYEILKDIKNVFYYENFYYTKIDNISNIIKLLEFGDIIYDNNLDVENVGIRIN